jgi:hypothetical protein
LIVKAMLALNTSKKIAVYPKKYFSFCAIATLPTRTDH